MKLAHRDPRIAFELRTSSETRQQQKSQLYNT